MGNFNKGSRSGRDSGKRDYGRRDSDRGSRRDFGRSRQSAEMHTVTCDECGSECEVPFKPNSDKPVYCSDCFKKKGGSSSRGNKSEQFDQINAKLDKIMEALKIEQ